MKELIEPYYNTDCSLSKISSLESELIASKLGSESLKFTEMMHLSNHWIDKDSNKKAIHISPYKKELDKQVELVAYKIESGMCTTNAIISLGTNETDWYKKLTDTHRMILQQARKKRVQNKLINKNK